MARAHGADMCLLIVKILEDQQLAELKRQIENLGMIAVIEIQNPQELERALAVNPRIILINNRHLDHFTVDLSTSENLAEKIPSHIHVIAASGIKTPEDLNRFSSRINGFLIGTSLMQAEDKENYLRECRRVRLPAPRT